MGVEYENELKKYTTEQDYLLSKECSNFEINLFNYRHKLKSLILNVNDSKYIYLINSKKELDFLNQYKEFILKTNIIFPRFIFDDFNVEKFDFCVSLQQQGYTLLEIEEIYKNVLLFYYSKVR